jgi:hypothetical protein
MSFKDFEAAIKSSELRSVALHWNEARGAKRMPGWKDIDPTAIGPHLKIIWSWKYDSSSDSFTGRIAGDDITQVFGESLRGKRMKDFFAGKHYDMVFTRHKRVVTEPAFAHGSGNVFIHARHYGLGERIIMPLAADGVHGDGILGATIYSLNPNAQQGTIPERYLEAEKVDFFPID